MKTAALISAGAEQFYDTGPGIYQVLGSPNDKNLLRQIFKID
jgi:hypothetical protein